MTIPNCWARIIPVLWLSAVPVAAPLAGAGAIDTLAHDYRAKNEPSRRAALANFAAARGMAPDAALARLALGALDLEHGRPTEALASLQAVRGILPLIGDHLDFAAARALVQLNRREEAIPLLEKAIAATPVSPRRGDAMVMAAEILLEAGKPQRAVEIVGPYAANLPAPKGLLVYGSCLEAAGDLPSAVMRLQRVYYEFPKSEEAGKAEAILKRIKPRLGESYPPATGAAMLDRTRKLIDGGDPRRALEELMGMEPYFSGAERDAARIEIGRARAGMRDYKGAISYLRDLKPAAAEADANRLFQWFTIAKRADMGTEWSAALAEFAKRQPGSPLRAQALTDSANGALVTNRTDVYEPIYRACAEAAPGDSRSAFCSFRVAWLHYLRRQPDAVQLLRRHVESFPASDDTASALYFLGRSAESNADFGSARAYYEAVDRRYPNFYYAMVSRERLANARVKAAEPNGAALTGLRLPPPGPAPDFDIDAATQTRIDRARLLDSAGLEDWAEIELRFAARNGAKPNVVAIEMTQVLSQVGREEQALRYTKAFSNGYLGWSFDQAPLSFWKAAFPMPYQEPLRRYSQERSLDPHIVAGLIRQESEFDAKVVSRSNAIGLAQIMPATGRDLSGRLGVRWFQTPMLYEPDYNLRLGSFYLRMLLDSLEKNWVAVLAAYNAGKSRADMWLRWADYSEPTEFIENIPFHETRNYVQIVLRNADMYRRVYGSLPPVVARVVPLPAPPPAAARAAAPVRRAPARKKR